MPSAVTGVGKSGCTFISLAEPEIALARSAVALSKVWALTPGTLTKSSDKRATVCSTWGCRAVPPSAALTPITTTYLEPNSVSATVVPITFGCALGNMAEGSMTIFRCRTCAAKNTVSRPMARTSQKRRRTMNVARAFMLRTGQRLRTGLPTRVRQGLSESGDGLGRWWRETGLWARRG